MKTRIILLLLITSILLYLLLSQNFPTSLFIHEDEIYPRPVVEIDLYCKKGVVKIMTDGRIDGCLDGRILELSIKLINNSSEASLRGYDLSAGLLLIIEGGKIIEYDIREFNYIIGISEELELTTPINSRMVEAFADYIRGGEVKQTYLKIEVNSDEDVVKISFRGWIVDEDKKIYNPVIREEEHYVARYPMEEYEGNPPDTRWAGKEFLKYKVYTVEIS
ncbi:MAG: hypothetical protein QXF28_04310 [Nitrososphaerota archaeon]